MGLSWGQCLWVPQCDHVSTHLHWDGLTRFDLVSGPHLFTLGITCFDLDSHGLVWLHWVSIRFAYIDLDSDCLTWAPPLHSPASLKGKGKHQLLIGKPGRVAPDPMHPSNTTRNVYSLTLAREPLHHLLSSGLDVFNMHAKHLRPNHLDVCICKNAYMLALVHRISVSLRTLCRYKFTIRCQVIKARDSA